MRDKDRVISETRTCDHYIASMTRRTRLWNTLYSRRPRVQEKANVANTKIDFKIAIDCVCVCVCVCVCGIGFSAVASGVFLSSEPCA